MSERGRGRIERLAPTGEGILREHGRVAFVEGALPGEDVEYEIVWRGSRRVRARVATVLRASPDRRPMDDHSRRCGGTDWAHFDPNAARRAKRELFLETMGRIGRLSPELFGDLPIEGSPLGYRLRNQLHARWEGRGRVRIGFYAQRSRMVVPLDGCEIVSEPARRTIAGWEERLAGFRSAGENATIATAETIETGEEFAIAAAGPEDVLRALDLPASVEIRLEAARFRLSAGAFFQVNRHLLASLQERVRSWAVRSGGGTALEAHAGSGFLSRALLDASVELTSVEPSPEAHRDARRNRRDWGCGGSWRYREETIESYLRGVGRVFDLVVADPPRGGLGDAAEELAARAGKALLYVSCDPATLGRDLARMRAAGLEIESAALFDFFALTHRVEAAVGLRRAP
jgi:tRNA/tmRNA/rRNA uracil-C5-methylase (TrmA/RlmC/RlmD family)